MGTIFIDGPFLFLLLLWMEKYLNLSI